MSEFDLIRRLTAAAPTTRCDVVIGPGDDAAVLRMPPGCELALTTDTLVAGRHFPVDTKACDLGWKALAVNLSDLAAMGADPAWITVALTLPEPDESWLGGFVAGLSEMLEASGAVLVGGDLTRGPLSVTIQAAGTLPAGSAVPRNGARPGDLIAVTGTLGDAALGLARWPKAGPEDAAAYLHARLVRPQPRIQTGRGLRGRASAAVDISDGLAADLGHILAASGVGATLIAEQLPASAAFAALCPAHERLDYQLGGGDDYELCVCLPATLQSAAADLTVIGRVEKQGGLRLVDGHGRPVAYRAGGYDHFAP